MKEHDILQNQFFAKLKDLVSPELSFADELADVLTLSRDSVYRRIRNETSLTLQEITLLCKHFKISFDFDNQQDSGNVTFYYERLNTIENFKQYLLAIRADLQDIIKSSPCCIYYTAVDIPIFHHFRSKRLTAFKTFYWVRSILNDPVFKGKKFDIAANLGELTGIAEEIYALYSQIPSIEVWTHETIQSHIDQILYCWESGLFRKQDEALQICNDTRNMIEHIALQAQFGSKATEGLPEASNPNYKLYYSEIGIGNNCIMTVKGSSKAVYLSSHTFNKLCTTDKTFCNETELWINNIIHKSTLISEVSEKTRYQFFQKCYRSITKIEQAIGKGEQQ